jgi:hypothetical protein
MIEISKITCVYISCHSPLATGGTEVLHQLGSNLMKMNIPVKMFYYNYLLDNIKQDPVAERFRKYKVPYTLQVKDSSDIAIIVPEIGTHLINEYKRATCILWWLSIDFYYDIQKFNGRGAIIKKMSKSLLNGEISKVFKYAARKSYDPFKKTSSEKVFHWVQSEYARQYLLKKGISKDRISYLSDYLNEEFINTSGKSITRNNVVLYNPKKGFKTTSSIIKASSHLDFIPLMYMTPSQVSRILMMGKVYIDFGHHPGKDRIPREAAMCGCIIITNKKGSANFYEDLPIPNEYKFEEEAGFESKVAILIEDIFSNYEKHYANFKDYREKIKKEEEEFRQNLSMLLAN